MAAMSKLSSLNARHAAVAGSSVAALLFYLYRKQARQARSAQPTFARGSSEKEAGKKGRKRPKAQVDAAFFAKIREILRICVPSLFSKEAGYALLVAVSLLARTYADVWMISNGTYIESSIIGRNRGEFLHHLGAYVCAMPAISVVNNLLKYGLNELKLCFRTRLSQHLYDRYMQGFTFYKMANIDNRIANADQLLTQDVEKLCESMVEVYSNLTKPLLDMILYIVRLSSAIGFQAPGAVLAYLFVSGIFLTWLRRPIGRMTVVEQQLEGELRFVNSRIITNSEEISFYQGQTRERRTLYGAFERLVAHLRKLLLFRFSVGFVDNIVAKYVATMVGFIAVSRPFFANSALLAGLSRSELMEEYYRSGRMMVRMAEAVGRLALAGRELTRLSGFTARVTELTEVLHDLNRGRYVRTMVASASARNLQQLAAVGDGPANADGNRGAVAVPGSGHLIVEDNVIRFENVPLVTPNGDVLIQSLDFEVRSGMNVLVCGPNGCGKSSLFRTLGELWPLFGGTLTKPDKSNLFYIPQRPYMTLGTLRDQIIYPDSPAKMALKGMTDEKLVELLGLVQLEYILAREGGWESVQDWMDVLSGGEKQRVAMARLFYHRPQFAILDECTSAVSVDVEGEMYQWCRGAGITLFTVSHRKSLWRHHEYVLHMDGRGAYDFKPIEETTEEFGS